MKSSPDEIGVLIAEYSEARDDERHFTILQGSVLTLAVAALSLLGALANEVAKREHPVASPLVAGAPLVVICMLAFLQAAGTQAVLRSFYLRSLERDLHARLSLDGDLGDYPGLRPMSYMELMTSYTTMARGVRFPRIMAGFVMSALWLVFGGLTVFLAFQLTVPWRLAMLLVYGTSAVLICANAIHVNVHGRKLFEDSVGQAAKRMRGSLLPSVTARPRPPGRRLHSYLAVPRPDDLVKGLFVVAGIILAWISGIESDISRHPHPPLAEIALFVVAVELLVYHSRYQWNDIRGVFEDDRSPTASARGRLPGGRKNVNISLAVMFVRLYLVGWIVSMQWGAGPRFSHTDLVLTLSVLAVYALAVAYEWVRARGRASGRSGHFNYLALLVVVGLGYPLRFTLGWTAMGNAPIGLEYTISLIAIWGLGVAFVTLTWILEGTSYVHAIEKTAGGNVHVVREDIVAKPHLLTLMRRAGLRTRVDDQPSDAAVEGKKWPILQKERWPWLTPWSAGTALWMVCVSLVGGPLVGLDGARPWLCGVLAAVLILLSSRWNREPLLYLAASVVLLLGFALSFSSEPNLARPVQSVTILILLCFLASLLYLFFWSMSYSDTRGGAHRAVQGVKVGLRLLHTWFVGGRPTDGVVVGSRPQRGTTDESVDPREDPVGESGGLGSDEGADMRSSGADGPLDPLNRPGGGGGSRVGEGAGSP